MSDWTVEQLLARAAFIESQVNRWKSNPGYVDTLRMEVWALRQAAERIQKSDLPAVSRASHYS